MRPSRTHSCRLVGWDWVGPRPNLNLVCGTPHVSRATARPPYSVPGWQSKPMPINQLVVFLVGSLRALLASHSLYAHVHAGQSLNNLHITRIQLAHCAAGLSCQGPAVWHGWLHFVALAADPALAGCTTATAVAESSPSMFSLQQLPALHGTSVFLCELQAALVITHLAYASRLTGIPQTRSI
jgi:hypothetical protein